MPSTVFSSFFDTSFLNGVCRVGACNLPPCTPRQVPELSPLNPFRAYDVGAVSTGLLAKTPYLHVSPGARPAAA